MVAVRFFGDDLITELDAFVTDAGAAGARDDHLLDLLLILSAERAPHEV